jgi:hypothetical protein
MANRSKDNLRRDVSDALIARGFTRSDRVHTLAAGDAFSLWVDTGPIGSSVDVAPFIGLRHDGVESLRATLLGTVAMETAGTVGANVGYVLGLGYRSWAPPTSVAEVMGTIEAGLDRLRDFMSLEKLIAAWDLEGAKRPGWHYSRIAAELYRGNRDAVVKDVVSARADLCKYSDEVCEQFTSFARRVAERL